MKKTMFGHSGEMKAQLQGSPASTHRHTLSGARDTSITLRTTSSAIALTLVLSVPNGEAQVVTDGTLGPAARIGGPNYQIATLFGTIRGQNLFHSFSQFSIANGERAVFQGASGTRFIIARVTGGDVSSINGQLTTAPLGASLFLINPAGIAFGSGASLNLGGSFHASTAGSLRLADGTLFSADPRLQGELTSSAPDSFIFNGPSGRISLEGSFLRVPELASVGLHAGSILLTQSGTQSTVITAPSGQISLSAFGGAGAVRLDGTRLSGSSNGSIQIVNGSLVTVSEGAQGLGGGRLVIRGGQVQVERSTLESRTRRGNGNDMLVEGSQSVAITGSTLRTATTGAGAAGGVIVTGSQSVALTGSTLQTATSGDGAAGDITLSGPQILLDAGTLDARCDTGCSESARGGNIRLNADDSITLRNNSRALAVTRASGAAGSITAQARDITLEFGSGMDTSCDPGCGSGSAGSLSVSASGSLMVRGTDATSFLVANSFGPGNAGRVELRAGNISLEGNAQVESITLRSGSSPGVSLDADFIRILNGAQVSTSTRGSANGGVLTANARRSLIISGTRNGTGENSIIPAGLISDAYGSGNAGAILILSPVVRVLAGGEISSSARASASGDGGRIAITANEEVLVDGSDTSGKRSAIVTNTFSSGNAGAISIATRKMTVSQNGVVFSQTEGKGVGGNIAVEAESLTIADGGQLATSALASGAGGKLQILLSNDLTIRGFEDPNAEATGIFSNSRSGANGGTILIGARNISLSVRGIISSAIDRSGLGGNIQLDLQGNLSLADDSRITSFSSANGLAGSIDILASGNLELAQSAIRTSARLADGGNISLRVGGNTSLSNGTIETAVGSGLGSGGNIAFASASLLMRNSAISANAFGGNGGNISIGSPLLIANSASRITASSTLGIDGTVQLDSPAIDLSALLSTPFLAYLDTTLVGSGSCLPRAAAAESRLALVASRKSAMNRLGPVAASMDAGAAPGNAALCDSQTQSSVLRP